MSTDDRLPGGHPALPARAQLGFAGPLLRASRAFTASGFPITWRDPSYGTFELRGPDAGLVHVEMTGGSLVLAIHLAESDAPVARELRGARLGPRDGETVTLFTELPLTASVGDADVRRAIAALIGAMRTGDRSVAA